MTDRRIGIRIGMGWALMALLSLEGCAPAVVAGGATSVLALGERRGMQEYMEDGWVANKIRSSFLQSDSVSLGNINVMVYQGVVLLTGTASSEEEIAQAVRLARATRGVRRVHAELKVQYITAGEVARDSLITSKVKSALLLDRTVRGLDIHLDTTRGIVYMIGSTQTVAERDTAVRLARQVDGVREVVSYIEVDPESHPVSTGAPENPEHSENPGDGS
jgi:osmotically-inducible protein OsmY